MIVKSKKKIFANHLQIISYYNTAQRNATKEEIWGDGYG